MTRTGRTRRPTDRGAHAYDAPKEFEGKRYTGMRVGRSHKWHYDRGVWSERKVTPDEWSFTFEVPKRRAGRAPEGSGAPVGTQYHWFILADQFVEKLDANVYSTRMNGLKVKLAHKRADRSSWSASDARQRRLLIAALQAMIVRLEGDALIEPETVTRRTPRAPARKPPKRPASGGSRRSHSTRTRSEALA
jgi:hypothetical protein